jgi:hypothetical protein
MALGLAVRLLTLKGCSVSFPNQRANEVPSVQQSSAGACRTDLVKTSSSGNRDARRGGEQDNSSHGRRTPRDESTGHAVGQETPIGCVPRSGVVRRGVFRATPEYCHAGNPEVGGEDWGLIGAGMGKP